MGKTISLYVADDQLVERAKEKASSNGHNFSEYVVSLIESDLSDIPPNPLSPTIMVDLTRRLSGEIDANRMALKIGNQDQPLFLRELLRDVLGDESGIRDAIKSRPSPVDKYRPSESRNEGAG